MVYGFVCAITYDNTLIATLSLSIFSVGPSGEGQVKSKAAQREEEQTKESAWYQKGQGGSGKEEMTL